MDFYSTVGGHRFIDGTVPQLVEVVERLAKAIEKANALKEWEFGLKPDEPLVKKEVEFKGPM